VSVLSQEGHDCDSADALSSHGEDKLISRVFVENEERSTFHPNFQVDDVVNTSVAIVNENLVNDDDELSIQTVEGYGWGTLGVIFGAITILIIFIIGCVFAPAISLDTSSITGLAVESGMTYEDVVSEYGVFIVISSILLRANFVLNSKADYVGLGFFLAGALASIACVFFIQAYHFIKRKLEERRLGPAMPLYGHQGCGLPLYFNLYKWKHMEIYIISVAIGVWQLGSACSYAIHIYCDILQKIFSVMAYIGLSDDSTAQCSRIQASLPGNLIIIGGSFFMLLLTFVFQAAAQYKKNINESLRFVDDCDLPMMSLAWSQDKNKNSRYSHLTLSLFVDEQLDESEQSSLPYKPGTTRGSPSSSSRSIIADNTDLPRFSLFAPSSVTALSNSDANAQKKPGCFNSIDDADQEIPHNPRVSSRSITGNDFSLD